MPAVICNHGFKQHIYNFHKEARANKKSFCSRIDRTRRLAFCIHASSAHTRSVYSTSTVHGHFLEWEGETKKVEFWLNRNHSSASVRNYCV